MALLNPQAGLFLLRFCSCTLGGGGGQRAGNLHSFDFCIFSSEVGDFDSNSCMNQAFDIKVLETCLDFVNLSWKQCPLTCPPTVFGDAFYNHHQV